VIIFQKNTNIQRLFGIALCLTFLWHQSSTGADLESLLKSVVVLETNSGHGSGVLLSESGVVVTNVHVLEGAEEVNIKLANGDIFGDVELLTADSIKDIVLLKVPGFDLPAAKLGNSNNIKPGDTVYAIGSPEGYDGTISRGIVSAIRPTDGGFKHLQIDAAISPGSSGGGIFNYDGELVGVTVAYVDGAQNLNFAVPINYVRGMLGSTSNQTLKQFLLKNKSQDAKGIGLKKVSKLDVLKYLETRLDSTGKEMQENMYLFDSPNLGKVLVRFIDQMLWIGTIYVTDDMQFSAANYLDLLKLNYKVDYAKVGISEAGDVNIVTELYLENATENVLNSTITSLTLADAAAVSILQLVNKSNGDPTKLEGGTRENYDERDFIGNKYSDYSYLDGRVTFDKPQSMKETLTGESGSGRWEFQGTTKGIIVIAEEIDLDSYELIPLIIEENAKSGGIENFKIIESGFREIRGETVFWSSTNGDVDGINISYEYNVYLNGGILVQFITFGLGSASSNLTELADNFLKTVRFK
jgi:hypothetical protein